MKLSVLRHPSFSGATIGKLYINGAFVCHTLEDEIREVPGIPVGNWKIKGASAIPAGLYIVSLEDSARFGPQTLTINNVPGFSSIRMHAGNTSEDTEGCVLLGMQATDISLVGGTSRPAVRLVKDEVAQAIARGESVSIEITNPAAA